VAGFALTMGAAMPAAVAGPAHNAAHAAKHTLRTHAPKQAHARKIKAADVPASTPAQWPGLNRGVLYSEGLLVGYRWYDAKGITPLFPFGFGLSYTTFSFSNLTVTPSSLSAQDSATVTVDVTNTGQVSGADTVRAYVADPASTGEPPEQLKGFDKVSLAPGQTATVSISLGPQSFSTWDTTHQSWVETPGQYGVSVGDSSSNLPLESTISIG
jgi:beta-glucosidase